MRQPLLTPMRLLIGIAAFTILCMFAVAVVTDRLADSFISHGGTVPPTSRVHLINEVTKAIDRTLESRREYLLTGDSSYLDSYRMACSQVDSSMDRLVSVDHEVTSNLAHAEDLREFVHAKLSEIGKGLEVAPAVRGAASVLPADTDLARVQKMLDALAQNEARDISGEMESARARATFHRDLMIALGVINVLFLIGVAFCAMRIGKLYSMITMCAWSKRVQYGDKWIPLEEYMKRRFGLRISHGISQEEYDKWSVTEGLSSEPESSSISNLPVDPPSPKAAA